MFMKLMGSILYFLKKNDVFSIRLPLGAFSLSNSLRGEKKILDKNTTSWHIIATSSSRRHPAASRTKKDGRRRNEPHS
jgi:hypothetical protein